MFACEILYLTFYMWKPTCITALKKSHMWNFTWGKSHHKRFRFWKFTWWISHVVFQIRWYTYKIAQLIHIRLFTCEISNVTFHIWNFTCEKSYVKFHRWTTSPMHMCFTCETSHVFLELHMWITCAFSVRVILLLAMTVDLPYIFHHTTQLISGSQPVPVPCPHRPPFHLLQMKILCSHRDVLKGWPIWSQQLSHHRTHRGTCCKVLETTN